MYHVYRPNTKFHFIKAFNLKTCFKYPADITEVCALNIPLFFLFMLIIFCLIQYYILFSEKRYIQVIFINELFFYNILIIKMANNIFDNRHQ